MNLNESVAVISFLQQVKAEVAQNIVGQTEIIEGLLAAIATGGHVLLEGNPGLGKTTLAKAFANSLKLGRRFGRIQFTPDLLPSDITGTQLPVMKGGVQELVFKRGPIFHAILLADEINRATPKTQAAMLEAMAEQQVTVLGELHLLTDTVEGMHKGRERTAETPFMVIATQNPIDQEGTYELPEAQADRFQLKLLMETPSTAALINIVEREAMGTKPRKPAVRLAASEAERHADDIQALPNLLILQELRELIRAAEIPKHVLLHAAYVVQATNGPESMADASALPSRSRAALDTFIKRYVEVPLGPRTAIALISVSKVRALLNTDPQDADQWHNQLAAAVEQMAPGVLRHRLKLNYDWLNLAREDFANEGLPDRPEAFRDRIIGRLVALTAPHIASYQHYFAKRA